ncbi:MAG: hypothetical protein AAF371_07260 [Pseudomonadota bacterium]
MRLPVRLAAWPRGVPYSEVLRDARAAIVDDGEPDAYRVAGFEAWIAPAAEGVEPWLCLPIRALVEHEPSGAVHLSARPLSVRGAKDLAAFAMAPPDWLAPGPLGALVEAAGFAAVREPGFADRVLLMPSFLGFAYESAAETLAAEGPSPAAFARMLSAVRLPGATRFEIERDLMVLSILIGEALGIGLEFVAEGV